MLLIYLVFYSQIALSRFMPSWYSKDLININQPFQHPHYRRLTKRYKRRLSTVKTLWTATGLFALLFPAPPAIVGATLFSTCLSFAILDESE